MKAAQEQHTPNDKARSFPPATGESDQVHALARGLDILELLRGRG